MQIEWLLALPDLVLQARDVELRRRQQALPHKHDRTYVKLGPCAPVYGFRIAAECPLHVKYDRLLNERPITVAVVSMNEAQAPTSAPLFSTPESAYFYHTSSPSCADRHSPRVVRSTGRSTTSMLRLCCFEFELCTYRSVVLATKSLTLFGPIILHHY